MSGPLFLVRATLAFATVGMQLYTRLLGRKRARVLMVGGLAVSTVVAVWLESR